MEGKTKKIALFVFAIIIGLTFISSYLNSLFAPPASTTNSTVAPKLQPLPFYGNSNAIVKNYTGTVYVKYNENNTTQFSKRVLKLYSNGSITEYDEINSKLYLLDTNGNVLSLYDYMNKTFGDNITFMADALVTLPKAIPMTYPSAASSVKPGFIPIYFNTNKYYLLSNVTDIVTYNSTIPVKVSATVTSNDSAYTVELAPID